MLSDPLGQTLAVDVLHDDEDTVVFFADFVDGADVGVVECGGGFRLVDQPSPGQIAPHAALGQHLDGDLAAERGVFRKKDLTHPARTQFPDDAVVADRRSCQETHLKPYRSGGKAEDRLARDASERTVGWRRGVGGRDRARRNQQELAGGQGIA